MSVLSGSRFTQCGVAGVSMGDENRHVEDGDTRITYGDLETAAFLNNKEFIQHWLQNSDYRKDLNFQKWVSELLRRAAYFHSVDVVECIGSEIASYGGRFASEL